jgi:hypothetical protein
LPKWLEIKCHHNAERAPLYFHHAGVSFTQSSRLKQKRLLVLAAPSNNAPHGKRTREKMTQEPKKECEAKRKLARNRAIDKPVSYKGKSIKRNLLYPTMAQIIEREGEEVSAGIAAFLYLYTRNDSRKRSPHEMYSHSSSPPQVGMATFTR